jgi:ElaB/YqjD/DUF883 family membrane-anchored ribosome-binding protein
MRRPVLGESALVVVRIARPLVAPADFGRLVRAVVWEHRVVVAPTVTHGLMASSGMIVTVASRYERDEPHEGAREMSDLFDKAKDVAQRAGDFAKDHADDISTGINKAGDLADKATGGRFTDQVDAVRDKAQEALGKTDEQSGPTGLTDPGH